MDYTAAGYVVASNIYPSSGQLAAITDALYNGFGRGEALIISIIANTILFIAVYKGLSFFDNIVFSQVDIVSNRIVKTRQISESYVEKYGILGITLVTLVPGPLAGAYIATILSWLVGMDWRKSMLAVLIGSAMGGLLILASITGLISAGKYILSGLF